MRVMQYFFVLLFSTIQFNSFVQTLKIVGDTVGIEPGGAYQYYLDVTGLPSVATNRIVNWVLVGNIDAGGISYADGDPSITKKYVNQVKWDNKANGANVSTIQATLNWTVGSTTYSKDSPKKQIQVKHIGPINNLTIGSRNTVL